MANLELHSLIPGFSPQDGERDARRDAMQQPVEAGGLAQLGSVGADVAGNAEAGAKA